MLRTVPLCLALIAAAPAVAATPQATSPADVVSSFIAAQRGFDRPALERLTAPDYVEISPIGEVDPREKMLGFYTPDKRQPTPEIVTTERDVRVHGDTALVTARLSIGPRAMRGVYVARRDAGVWRLISAQFTPIRVPVGG
jgi:ketosteroid isomerase-like protein